MKKVTRRTLLGGGAAAALAIGGSIWWSNRKPPLGLELKDTEIEKARQLLATVPSVDIHTHAGRSFVQGGEDLSLKLTLYAAIGSFEEDAAEDMRAGELTVAALATVSDFDVLDLGDKGLSTIRPFHPGEAWRSYQRQIARLKSLIEQGLFSPVRTAADIIAVKAANGIGALFSAEGGDFLETDLSRLDTAHDDGIRIITLVHYRHNDIGDIMTEAPKHGGLTDFGAQVVRRMEEKGMLIDLAHASRDTARQVLDIAEKPVLFTHTAIRGTGFDHPRFIDLDLAKAAVEAGGLIGAWPVGIGLSSLSDYVDQIFRLVDLLGIDAIAIGSDMDANYKPVYYDFRQLPLLVAALMQRGMQNQEIAKIVGGNFIRVFKSLANG